METVTSSGESIRWFVLLETEFNVDESEGTEDSTEEVFPIEIDSVMSGSFEQANKNGTIIQRMYSMYHARVVVPHHSWILRYFSKVAPVSVWMILPSCRV